VNARLSTYEPKGEIERGHTYAQWRWLAAGYTATKSATATAAAALVAGVGECMYTRQ